MKRKKIILALICFLLIASLAIFAPPLNSAELQSSSVHQTSLNSIHALSDNVAETLTLPQTNTEGVQDISPLTFLLLSSVGLGIVGIVSIAVIYMGPEKGQSS